jgi:undecaprenyl-phosphate 4-deoxy-4-formamido-L-arabinose transferase
METFLMGKMDDSQASAPRPEFSIAVACYQEEPGIQEFHARLRKTVGALGRTCEIVFVDDGSTDGTPAILDRLFDEDETIGCLVHLADNVGQANALTAAIVHARGEHVVIIDSDLQVDPEELPRLVEVFDQGYDLVGGRRRERHDPLYRVWASAFVNLLLQRASGCKLRDIGCGFKIMRGSVIRAFNIGPTRPFRPVSVMQAPVRMAEVDIAHHPRKHGHSAWSLRRLFAFYRNILVETSQFTFQVTGILCLLVSLMLLGYAALSYALPRELVPALNQRLVLGLIALNLLLTVGLLAAIGEFVRYNTRLLQQDPCYFVRELRRR